jgi:pimeloyl-ACP methyl ester carboxylesterase
MMVKMARLSTRQVRYLEAGSGRPVVFLHAFPLHADQWLPQLARLPRGWRGVAPDLRGFRGDDPPDLGMPGPLSVDTYAADVLELMAHLDMPSATVVGLSMGGYVAFALVRRARARVTGLVLADTRATADTPDARAGRDRMRQLVAERGVGPLADEMIPTLLSATTRRAQPDLADAVGQMIHANAPAAVEAALLALRDRPDSTPLLATLTCPVTVIVGAEDTLTPPAVAEDLTRAIPGAALTIVPDAGHLSNLEQPGAFTDALAGALAREG